MSWIAPTGRAQRSAKAGASLSSYDCAGVIGLPGMLAIGDRVAESIYLLHKRLRSV